MLDNGLLFGDLEMNITKSVSWGAHGIGEDKGQSQ